MLHKMDLQDEYYNYILSGTKRIEIRFNKHTNVTETFDVEVIGLLRYNSFEDMFKDLDISILADKSMTKEELITVLEKFYTKEQQRKYGVLGIRFKLV